MERDERKKEEERAETGGSGQRRGSCLEMRQYTASTLVL